jgi:hypothetical protein
MKSLVQLVMKYWRGIAIVICLLNMVNSLNGDWGTNIWKSPDQVTIYENSYGQEVGRQTTQMGLWNSQSYSAGSFITVVSSILLLILVFLYWKRKSRKLLAIPYLLLFCLIWLASAAGASGDGASTFFVSFIVLGIVMFSRKRRKT